MKNINKKLLYVIVSMCFIACSNDENPDIAQIEPYSREAFEYLNQVRQNPSAFSHEIGDDLSYVVPRHKLIWNKQLQTAAENKAKDMVARNYISHIDPDGYGMNYFINKAGYSLENNWLSDKGANNFESLAAGSTTGKQAIIELILDAHIPKNEDKGHRIHLLGIDPFWANCYDIGIGMAYTPNSVYKYYCCILIAKHTY